MQLRELDGEASEVVGGVGLQGEGAAVLRQDVTDEQQTEALPLRLGGEEGGEEVFGFCGRDAAPVVGDGEGPTTSRPTPDPSLQGGEGLRGDGNNTWGL